MFATRTIATLLDSGIPLDETLKSIAAEVEDKSLSIALHSVRDELLQGSRIAEAMSSHEHIFNDTYRSLIAAGDTAGNLHIAFANLADYLEEAALVRATGRLCDDISCHPSYIFNWRGFCIVNICNAPSR